MLDTNIVSDLVRSPQGRVFDRIAALGSDTMCISIITAAELRYGCTKKGSPRLLAQVETILGSIEILPSMYRPMLNMAAFAPNWRLQASRSRRMIC
jgi:tRNA(fMet)-specific endonuclease VapC